MFEPDPTIIVFALILLVSLVVPEILKEAKMVVIPVYIIAGIIVGPHGLQFESHAALEFIGDIGLLFLVFIAGLEIVEHGKVNWKKPVKFSILSAGTCFLFGFGVGTLLDIGMTASLLLGTILMSSSVGEIIPIVTSSAHLREKFANFLIPSIIIMDASSLFLLTIFIRMDEGTTIFLFFLGGALFFTLLMVFVLPRLAKWFFSREISKPRETDLKFIIVVLAVSVAFGEALGLHGILIAFMVGAVLGRYIPNEKTHQKLHGFGYGFFIPIFFIVLGMSLDMSFLWEGTEGLVLVVVIISTLMLGKLLGAAIFARTEGLTNREGLVLGVTVWPQLSATLAAAAVGFEEGIFDTEILTAIVFMSITTALATPFIVQALLRQAGAEEQYQNLEAHILIVGYGRTSAKLAYLLDIETRDFIVVDRKLSRVNLLKKQGIRAILGEGDNSRTLQKANVEKLNTAVIAVPDDHEVYLCAKLIRESNPDCHIIARIHNWETYEKMKKEKLIDFAVWPEKLSSEIIIQHMIKAKRWANR